jgi:hypothetical protein
MKCDASDCSNDATHFELCDGEIFFKWCTKCAKYCTELEDDYEKLLWELISEEEYAVRAVMAS